jgi:pimeloyl-ACP methyl ester carboxylesterase
MSRSVDGTAYQVAGPDGAPGVVLIHGLGLCREMWRGMVAALRHEFRVVSYDLAGHGQSPAMGAPSLRGYAAQIADFLDQLKVERGAIVGFSLGGMIAGRFAQDYPGRATALGVLNSPHQRSEAAEVAIAARVAQARAEGLGATVEAALERWFTDGFRAANLGLMAKIRGWILANDRVHYPRAYSVFADGVGQVVAPDPPLRLPSLVLTSADDFGNSPQMARAIAVEISGTELHILPELRHMALLENPALCAEILLNFLRKALLSPE